MKRESFKSRLGFLTGERRLCNRNRKCVEISRMWQGRTAGDFLYLLYLVFLVGMGLPVLTMELAVGRASRKSAVLGYKALEKRGSKWHIHGWVAIFGCYMLMMYYTTVSGWMVNLFL